MKERRSPTLVRWYLSYILILLLCVASGIGISLYARSVSFRQANQIHQGLMSQVQIDVDSYIRGVFNLFERISLNTNIAKVISGAPAQDPYNTYLLARDFSIYKTDIGYAQNVFLYNGEADKIISSAGYLDAEYYYSLYYPTLDMTFEEFRDNLNKGASRGQLALKTTDNSTMVAFIQTVIPTGSNKKLTACVLLQPSHLAQRLHYIRWNEEISIVIQDEQRQTIASIGPHTLQEEILTGLDQKVPYSEQRFDGKHYGVFSQRSALIPWSYVSVVPISIVYKSAGAIGVIAVISLVACSTVGVLLARSFSRKNYTPLKEAIDVLAQNLDAPIEREGAGNEYAWLKTAAKAYVDKLQTSYAMMEDYNRYIKNHLLFRLLETPFDAHRDAKEMQRAQVHFSEPHFLVLNFYYSENQALLLSTNLEQGKNGLSQAVMNVFGGMMRECFPTEVIDMGDRVSAIINLPSHSSNALECVRENVYKCQEVLEGQLNVGVKCAIGAIHSDIGEIYLSSNEAKEAAGFLTLQDSTSVVLYEDIKNLRQGYSYPLEQERQIVAYIAAGNEEKAVSAARKVFRQNAQYMVGEMRKCLILDMLGTMIKAANQSEATEAMSSLDIMDIVTGNSNEEKLLQAIGNVCRQIEKERAAASRHKGLITEVKKYIGEHYADPDVNVSAIGRQFYLTPAYLSSLFKEETGVSLLDYVNAVRIEKAKELLLQRMNVADVAAATGFRTSGSLIRVFKRQEKMPPGQWVNRVNLS